MFFLFIMDFFFEPTTHSFWRRTYSGPRRTHEIFHVVVNYTFGKRLIKKLHLWENLGWKVFTSYSFILIYVMIKWRMILISFLVKPVERHISVCGAIGYHWERIILVSQNSQAIFTMPFFSFTIKPWLICLQQVQNRESSSMLMEGVFVYVIVWELSCYVKTNYFVVCPKYCQSLLLVSNLF